MDYTNREENNRQPDSSNFQFLFELYGLIPGAQPFAAPTVSPTTAAPSTSSPSSSSVSNGGGGDGGDKGDRRLPKRDAQGSTSLRPRRIQTALRTQKRRRRNRIHQGAKEDGTEDHRPLADWLQDAVDQAMQEFLLDPLNVVGTADATSSLQEQPPPYLASRSRWRLLHRNTYSEAHELELHHGTVLQVHKLLAHS